SVNRLMDALKHCADMLFEMRATMLGPKQYYELYMIVFDELQILVRYLKENVQNNPKFGDLYELVQYAGNIVPRLYLMITVGSVYVDLELAPKKAIIEDMLDMCRGVQNPIRGLFLRHYFGFMIKETLSKGESAEMIEFSTRILIENFIEMNKLWVRMQYQGSTREKEKRENERKALKTLVGSVLMRLSQIEGLTKEVYLNNVLNPVLEQIVECNDVIAQEYLIDVVIQAFSEEWHLFTLRNLLDGMSKLRMEVNFRNMMIALVNRFIQAEKDGLNKNNLEEFLQAVISLIEVKVIFNK
ncbi:putative vacuolar protein sorting 35, partial [Rozella allomycis CSF55]